MSQFVHLNVHSEFSIVDSTIRIPQLIDFVSQQQMPAVAITDFNNMYAAIKFYKKTTAAGIKPILGAELEIVSSEQMSYKLLFYCQNRTGYLNLSELISLAHQQGYHQGKPKVKEEWILQHHQGLIVVTSNMQSDIGQLITEQKLESAAAKVEFWKRHLQDRYYLGVSRIGRDNEDSHNQAVLFLAAQSQVPLVAMNDCRFASAEDFNAHEARVCINQGHVLADPRRNKAYTRQQYLSTEEEMLAKFEDLPSALQNTVEIAKRCNLSFDFGEYFLPDFPIPEGETIDQFFRRLTAERLQQYLDDIGPADGYSETDYFDRLKFEVDIILQMGFPGYFLIVADFINWSKKNDIPVGPGRGSGAGSLVAFVLSITDLDPLEYELLFERFLNPERISMPDFDVDFCMDRRDEVIDYVARTYGANQVSQIITFGTMSAKAVVRDVGRVLGYPYGMVDSVAKLIPNDLGITLTKALKESAELNLRKETDEEVSELLDMALQLEGLTRNTGKHAGGVVIAPDKLSAFCPVYKEQHSEGILSQYDKDDVETIGLVKFDFLGLRTLTIVKNAVDAINRSREPKGLEPVDISKIPLDDKKAFDLLKACNTTAVFQLESHGMKELIGRLVPDSFAEIIALVALYRPGPLDSGMVDTYVECKHGRKEPDYMHADIEDILQPTYGVILYQEQVMKIAQVLSGYSLGSADILRKAMGKKIPEVMEAQGKMFVDGAVDNGVDKDLAIYIFDMIKTFAGYGFNKSHSAAYALIAYQTAWLKAHYPVEFMASVMSADMDNTEKVVHLIEDVKSANIQVQIPNINVSDYYFKAGEGLSIVYGLGAIKGVGKAAIESVMKERDGTGPFKSLYDFCVRVDMHKVNKRTLEALILSGAFDSLHTNRNSLLSGMENVLKAAAQKVQDQQSGQVDLFGAMPTQQDNSMPIELPAIEDFETNQRLFLERNMLGHFMSGHPLRTVSKWVETFTTHSISKLLKQKPAKVDSPGDGEEPKFKKFKGQEVVVAGLITSVRKRNENSASLMLADESKQMECTFFKNTFFENEEKMIKDEIVVIQGEAGVDNYTNNFIIRSQTILTLDEAIALYCDKIAFQTSSNNSQQFIAQLKHLLGHYGRGKAQIYIHHKHDGVITNLKLGKDYKIRPSYHLIKESLKITSIDKVILK